LSSPSEMQEWKYRLRRLLKLGSTGPAEGQAFYEDMYNQEEEYRKDFRDSIYLTAWTQVYRFLRQIPEAKVLEVGCGSGQLASFLRFMGFDGYERGFDLSNQAVEIARQRLNLNFQQGDACDPKVYEGDYNTIITLETLEHIPDDFSAMKNFRPGVFLIMSLPDFEYESHYRWFTNARQIEKRYYQYLNVRQIVKVEKWYVIFGKIEPFNPSILQRAFRTREQPGLRFFWSRYLHPLLGSLGKPLIRACFSR